MKKILMITAVLALAFTACKPKPGPEPEPTPVETTFQITVSDITASEASVAVTPSVDTVFYYFDIMSASYASQFASMEAMADTMVAYLVEEVEYYAANGYGQYGYPTTLEEVCSKGADDYDFEGLDASTDYIAFAFVVDVKNQDATGKVATKSFTTQEVQNVNLLFELAQTDTAIWFLPNDEDLEYLPFIVDADSLNGYTIAEYYDLYAEYLQYTYGEYFEYYCLMYGPIYISYDDLEAGHNYLFAARAYTAGVWNSELVTIQFAGPADTPKNAPAKVVKKGQFNKQMKMKNAKKVQKVNAADFNRARQAK